MLSNLEEHQVTAIIQVMKHNIRLASNFLPQRFDGDMLLFAATQDDAPPPRTAGNPTSAVKSRSTKSTASTCT